MIRKYQSYTIEVDTNVCSRCNSIVYGFKTERFEKCLYCSADIKDSGSKKISVPSMMIPFSINQEEADKMLKEKIQELSEKTGFKIPSDIKAKGVFIPYYLHSLKYEEKLTYLVNNEEKVKEGSIVFDKLLTDACIPFDNRIASNLEPFDFDKLVEFDINLASNYYIANPDVNEIEALEDSKKKATYVLHRCLLGDENGDVRIKNSEVKIEKDGDPCLILLPVYMFTAVDDGEVLQIFFNGQTGELAINSPAKKSYNNMIVAALSFLAAIIAFIFVSRPWGLVVGIGIIVVAALLVMMNKDSGKDSLEKDCDYFDVLSYYSTGGFEAKK